MTNRLITLVVLLLLAFASSLRFGQFATSWLDVWLAFTAFDPTSVEQTIVMNNRLSRALVALVVGAAMAVAGVLSQTLTRNPLASPSTLGLSAGALFFIALCLILPISMPLEGLMLAGFAGALLAVTLVFLLATNHGVLSPFRLILAGAAMGAIFTAMTQGMLVADQRTLSGIVYWLGGSVSGRELSSIIWYAPLAVIVSVSAVLMAKPLNILLLDDQLATSLGQSLLQVRMAVVSMIVILAGGAVAVAGMIPFVGLVVPHIARLSFGSDHKWLLPSSAMIGAMMLLVADTLSRYVAPPQELPIAAMTAIIGVPIFISLVMRRRFSL